MNRVKRFTEFINEARHWSEDPWLANKVAHVFNNFPAIEAGVVDLIDTTEEEWKHIKESFWWNRETGGFNKDHFALDVKVHAYPDNDKLRSATGKDEEDLDDEAIDNMWWRWFEDQREFFQEDIEQSYGWVGHVGWGGKSGGWLLLSPEYTGDDVVTELEELVQEYEETIDSIKEDPEQWAELNDLLNSDDFEELTKMGLAEYPEEAADLIKIIDQIKTKCKSSIDDFKQWFNDMTEIQNRVSKFEETASDQFHTWAVEEIEERSL